MDRLQGRRPSLAEARGESRPGSVPFGLVGSPLQPTAFPSTGIQPTNPIPRSKGASKRVAGSNLSTTRMAPAVVLIRLRPHRF